MSENRLEDLSAFADGELSASETQFFARRLAHDQSLRHEWHRLHLVRGCLQGSGACGLDLTASVRDAIEAEPQIKASFGSTTPGWLRPIAGMAVAATVAVAALMALRGPGLSESTESPQVPSLASSPGDAGGEELLLVPTGLNPPVSNVSWSNQQSSRDTRLRAYLMRHNDEAAKNRRFGLGTNIYLMSRPEQVQEQVVGEPNEILTSPGDTAAEGQ